MTEKGSWGGKRENQTGRPPLGNVTKTFRYDPEVAEFLAQSGRGGALASEIVKKSKAYREWLKSKQ